MPRPTCHNCGRRTSAGSFAGVRVGATGEEQPYCTHRRACRIALQKRFMNPPLTFAWPSDTAYAAADEAADLVDLPWPLRWMPGSVQDEVRRRFTKALASAVEQRLAEAPGEIQGSPLRLQSYVSLLCLTTNHAECPGTNPAGGVTCDCDCHASAEQHLTSNLTTTEGN